MGRVSGCSERFRNAGSEAFQPDIKLQKLLLYSEMEVNKNFTSIISIILAQISKNRETLSLLHQYIFIFRLLLYICHQKRQVSVRYCLSALKNSVILKILGNQDNVACQMYLRIRFQSFVRLSKYIRRPKSHGWKREFEIIIFLSWLASGSSYRGTATLFSVPRTTVFNVVNRILIAVLQRVNNIMKPPDDDDLIAIGEGFVKLANHEAFKHVAGAIDSCDIRVKYRKTFNYEDIERKHCYLVHVQGICDHRMLFIDIFNGYPVIINDKSMLRLNSLFRNSVYPPEGYFLLGDCCYPCISKPLFIISPYQEPVTSALESAFNKHHASAHSVVKHAFGLLKLRWKLLFKKTLEIKVDSVPKVIAACAAIHNICLLEGDTLEHEAIILDQAIPIGRQRDNQVALVMRERLAAEVSSFSLDIIQ